MIVRGTVTSYAALEEQVRRFAAAYERASAAGVVIALPQCADAYAAMLGAGLAGCYYAPLHVDVPVDKLLRIVRQMRPDVIVAEPAIAQLLRPAAEQARFVHPASLPAPLAGRGKRHETAYIIFTSGTTGDPKGVMIPRAALDHFIDWVSDSKFITPQDRVAQFSNIAFDVSVTDIYGALGLGACLFPVVGRADRMFPARLVARERITVWNSTPSVIGLMMQADEATREHLGSLRIVNTCGEALLAAHVAALFAALPETAIVQNSYGPTETTVTMTELRLDRKSYREACESSVAIGFPIAHMTIDLMGGPHADEGEIVITGPQLAQGYWGDPDRTAAAFKTIMRNGEPTRAYCSGDWAIRRGGYIFFKERIDKQIKLRGHRLELDEVARAIHDYGFPVTCVLKWQDELAAVIERRVDRPFDESLLRAALARQLEPHAIPTTIRLIDRMPHTLNDKLDRQAVSDWLDEMERRS